MEGETHQSEPLPLPSVDSDEGISAAIEAELAELAAGDSSGGGGGGIKSKVKGPWSTEEDAVLTKLVSKLGPRNWSLIARGIPGRSGKSCRLRWCNQLDPCLKRKPFSGINNFKPSILLYLKLDSCFWVFVDSEVFLEMFRVISRSSSNSFSGLVCFVCCLVQMDLNCVLNY